MFGMGMMNNIFGGGGSGVGAGASSSPFANAATTPTIRPAGGSSYNAFLDPSSKAGGIAGVGSLIGKLTGAPTLGQAQGQANGQAMGAILQLAQTQGLTFQQAAQKFFTSPEGQDFFINGDMEGFTRDAQMYAATPQQPGAMMLDSISGDTTGAGVPTTKEQEMVAMLGGAALTPEQEALVYRAGLAAQNAPDTTETERLYQEAERLGMMSHEQVMKIRTFKDRYLQQPITNANKEVIGWRIVDVLNEDPPIELITNTGQLGLLVPPQVGGTLGNQALAGPTIGPQGQPAQGEVIQEPPMAPGEGAPPEMDTAPGSGNFGVDPNFQVSGDIVQGAGLANTVEAGVGRVWGQIFSDFSGVDATHKQQALDQIGLDFAKLATGRLKGIFDKADKVIKTRGIFTNVEVLAQQLIDLRMTAEAAAVTAARRKVDPNISPEARLLFEMDYYALEDAVKNVPSVTAMEAEIEKYKANPQGSIPQAIDKATGASSQAADDISGALGGDTGAPMIDFPSITAAQAAIAADPDNFPPRTRFTVQGKPAYVP